MTKLNVGVGGTYFCWDPRLSFHGIALFFVVIMHGIAEVEISDEDRGVIASMDLVGDVKDADVIIVDDMIDSAGTLCKAAAQIKKFGARRVFAFASHGIFSGPANERIKNSALEKVVVINSIPLNERTTALNPKILQLSVAPLLAKAILAVQSRKSVSSLFDNKKNA
jgi:ribose-phosphate pyrophosphokinase